ncbi:TatD family hydrolase [Tumebacillus permanentifrigoris]|uniref:TatD DNase family protein n=1 Tax=Tumebacillus permanentifrigoris TaxID=378543 RepID=A0A316DYM7_9BACL|nr:TatD family hydrolase [Tumebacillus permanentifrigoris]PWK15610.1 TatD DNase family protein [Tumebacillus permanentifrigoris]
MFDAHLHLEQYPDEQIEGLIESWRIGGIQGVVAVSTGLRSAHRTLDLQQRFPDFVRAALGTHPEQPVPPESELVELLQLIELEKNRLSAIGEVGLPHYALAELGTMALDDHLELFGVFAKLAARHRLPLVLHAVHDKVPLALEVLQRHRVERAHFHWLKAVPADLQRIVEAGYYVSVTPDVCHRERDQQLARHVPLSQLLFETDGPWPHVGPLFAGRPTSPLFLHEMVGRVAQLKGVSQDALAQQVRANVDACYAPPSPNGDRTRID